MGFAKRYFKSKSHSCKAGGTTVVQVDLPWLFNYFTPPEVPPVQQTFLHMKIPNHGKHKTFIKNDFESSSQCF